MKKKAPAKLKRMAANPKKPQGVKTNSGRIVQMKAQPQRKPNLADDPQFAQAVQNYEAGLRAMQEHKFERAKSFFQKVVAGNNKELSDRAAVHLNTCNQQLSRAANVFKTLEEHYDYAVSLMNLGDYVSAREHLEKLIKQAPRADYVWYGLAVLECLTGHYEESLKHLQDAIKLNTSNRFQARNDSDFQALADDPRFTELLYPEAEEPGVERQ